MIAGFNLLLKQAVLIIDAVAVPRHTQRGKGIQKACRQTPAPTIPQRRVILALHDVLQLNPHLLEKLAVQLNDSHIGQVGIKGAANQEFHR